MCKRLLFFCAFIYFAKLFSAPLNPHVLASQEGDPSIFIEGVCALTGEWSFSQKEIVVEGAEPIIFTRNYLSGDGTGKFAGWSFFPHQWLILVGGKNGKPSKAVVKEANGSEFSYFPEENQKVFHIQLTPGVANTARGEISARTNLRNQFLERTGDCVCLFTADKAKRFYSFSHSFGDDLHFLLKKEELSNGNWTLYSYDIYHRLVGVRTTTPHQDTTLAECLIQYLFPPKQGKDFDVVDNNSGKRISYRFSANSGAFSFPLNELISSLDEECNYYIQGHSLVTLLDVRKFPERRFIKATYFPMYGETSDALTGGKIKTLFGPRGKQGEVIPIYHFSYISTRQTEVTDAEGNKTIYFFSSQYYPEHIEYWDKSGILKKVLEMLWNEHGELTRKCLRNAAGDIISSREYTYDDHGNILSEIVSEDFSGIGKKTTYQIKREYDSLDRLLSIKEETGKITTFEYLGDTSLVTAKKIGDKNKIWLREFNFYDQNHLLRRQIIDDGIGRAHEDLTNIHLRKIREITPRTASPFYGMIESIEEKTWNPETQEEVLLNKTTFHYNHLGKIAKKEIFDAHLTFAHSWEYEYDAAGRLIQEINPLRYVTKNPYDKHGNILEKKIPGQITTYFAYDTANRCIKKTEGDLSYFYDYNAIGHCIQMKDPVGNISSKVVDCFGNCVEEHLPPQLNEHSQIVYPKVIRSFDIEGRVIMEIDPADHLTKKRYNSKGQIAEIIYPDESSESFSYNLDGTIKEYIDQEGVKTHYDHDLLGHMISKQIFAPDGKILQKETWEYNSFHLMSEKNAAGHETKYSYDFAGRKSKIIFPNGSMKTYLYNDLGQLEKIFHHDLVTIFLYDSLNRIIEQSQETLSGKLLSKMTYTYDQNGNIGSITKYCNQGSITFSKKYDSFGRVILEQDSSGYQKKFEYGDNENKIITHMPSGICIEEIYNRFEKLNSKRVLSQKNTLLLENHYVYSINNELMREELWKFFPPQPPMNSIRSFEYDVMGRVIRIHETNNEKTKTTSFAYTPSGLIKRKVFPENVVLDYEYDHLKRISSVKSSDQTVSYTIRYNENSLPVEICDRIHLRKEKRIYDVSNQLTEETLSNGLTIKNTFDEQGRRTFLSLPDQTGIEYVYGPKYLERIQRIGAKGVLRYRHSILDYDLGGFPIQQSMTEDLGTMGLLIDDKKHLIPESLWIKKTEHPFTYEDYLSLLLQESFVSPLFQFTTPQGAEEKSFQFDALGRLISVKTPEKEISFTYDFWNRCMNKTVLEKKKNVRKSYAFLYDNDDEIGMIDLFENPDISHPFFKQLKVRTTDAINTGDGAIAYELNDRAYVPLHDPFGSVSKILSVNLHLTKESYSYNDFGQERIFNYWEDPIPLSALENPWRFKGQRIDEDCGIIFFKEGYYDPTWVQFFPISEAFTNNDNRNWGNLSLPFCFSLQNDSWAIK